MTDDPSNTWDILFLRDHRDAGIYRRVLSVEQRAALRVFLHGVCASFEVAYRAAKRNAAYVGLVKSLLRASHHEWTEGWEVHWHIGIRHTPKPSEPYEIGDFVLYIEALKER